MTNPETAACRTTQHCAHHGWCRRCDPAFAAVMSRVNVAIQRTDADESHWGPLYEAVGKALRPAAVSVPPPAPRADDQAAVRVLHQPMQRGPFTICAHCSGWDGKWRCLGVVTDYPCPTIRALDGEQQPVGPCVAGEQQNETPDEALPFIHVDDDSDQLEIGAVMASTYDGEAPVVYVATEQHQGDQVATVYVRPERVERVVAALRSARRAAETLPAVVAQPGKEHGRG